MLAKLGFALLSAVVVQVTGASDKSPYITLTQKNGHAYFSSKRYGTFFSVGSNSFMEAAANNPMKAVFRGGSLKKIYEEQLAEYESFGFNTLGGWSNTTGLRGRLPYTKVLFDDDEFPRAHPLIDCHGRALPSGDAEPLPNPVNDPFSPVYKRELQAYFAKVVRPYRADPALMLYWVGHEFGLGGSDAIDFSQYLHSPDIRQEFQNWLRNKYRTVEALSRAWKSSDATIEQAVKRCGSDRTGEMADRRAFSKVVLRRWFELVTSEIRRADPNHLLSTPKLSIWDFEPGLARAREAGHFAAMVELFDLISVDWYTSAPEHSEVAYAELSELSRELKMPVLVAEFGTRQRIEGWTNTPGAKKLLSTQAERGARYESQVFRMYRENWIVGAHWFRWQDHITDHDQMNKGIVRVDPVRSAVVPYLELKEAVKRTHESIAKKVAQ